MGNTTSNNAKISASGTSMGTLYPYVAETYAPYKSISLPTVNMSPIIDKLAPALLAAQKTITTVTKEANNPFFKSKYASLENVIDACKAQLNEQDIVVLQPIGRDDQGHYVETVLLHTSGQYISSRMYLVLTKEDMQGLGSATSYARRYSLQSLVFLASGDDDDGEAAVGRTAVKKSAAPIAKPTPVAPTTGFKAPTVNIAPTTPTVDSW